MYLRKCVACGKQDNKFNFIRVNRIRLDSLGFRIQVSDSGCTSHVEGRTAYICPSIKCFNLAKKKSRFEKNLKCKVDSNVYDEVNDLIIKNS